jgi:hypothetical protein
MVPLAGITCWCYMGLSCEAQNIGFLAIVYQTVAKQQWSVNLWTSVGRSRHGQNVIVRNELMQSQVTFNSLLVRASHGVRIYTGNTG